MKVARWVWGRGKDGVLNRIDYKRSIIIKSYLLLLVAVMYGGSDSQSNLILLCSNCHTLVHDYERGRFHPEEETIEKYPHVKKILILGNMLAIMKKKALHILRTKHENTARLVDRNKMGLGKAILKHGLALDGEQYFNGSPYKTFVEASENIDKGMEVAEGLGDINYEVEEDKEE